MSNVYDMNGKKKVVYQQQIMGVFIVCHIENSKCLIMK